MKIILNSAAAEKYVKWAKSKLIDLRRLRKDLNLPSLTKLWVPEAGFKVQVHTAEWDEWIRITGAVSHGRVLTRSDSRLYVIQNKKLEFNYTDGTGTGRTFHSSLNGKTLSYFGSAPDDFYRIARRARVSQITGTPAPSGVDFSALPVIFGAGKNNYSTSSSYFLNDDVTLNQTGAIMCSDNGNEVAVISDFLLPALYRISDAQLAEESRPSTEWSPDTDYDLVTEGLPAFVNEFYASLPIPHSHDEIGSLSMNVYALRTNAFPAATIGPVYWLFVSSTIAPGNTLRIQFFPVLDHSSGRVLLLSCLPYVTRYISNLDEGFVLAPTNVRLTLHELVNDAWTQLAFTDVADGVQLFFNEAGSPATGTFDGLPYAVTVVQPLSGYNRLVTNYYVPLGTHTSPKIGEIIYNRLWDPFAGGGSGAFVSTSPNFIQYSEEGVVLFDDIPGWNDALSISGQIGLLARGRNGYLFDIKALSNTAETYAWYTRASATVDFEQTLLTDAPIDLFLSSDGNKLWTRDNTNFKYYELGELLLTTLLTIPSADAAGFALYGVVPEEGFYFVKFLHAWSYKREALRAIVYTHIEQTGPSSYEWRTATVILQYKDSAVRVIKTLSDVGVEYPSKGRLVEDDPFFTPPVITLSEAQLFDDEFFPDVI